MNGVSIDVGEASALRGARFMNGVSIDVGEASALRVGSRKAEALPTAIETPRKAEALPAA
jgi:hypothetical protein